MLYRVESLLDDMDTDALFGLLGDAWCAQFQPCIGESYFLESSLAIGRREFGAIVPFLRAAPMPFDSVHVIKTVKKSIDENGFWQMPPYVVAALAARADLSALNCPAKAH